MTIVYYLTHAEWEACYFAGMREVAAGKPCENIQEQVRLGRHALRQAGYVFQSHVPDAEGHGAELIRLVPIHDTLPRNPFGPVGIFDPLQSAREALDFAARAVPAMDWDWLRQLLYFIDTHDTPVRSFRHALDVYQVWLFVRDDNASQRNAQAKTTRLPGLRGKTTTS